MLNSKNKNLLTSTGSQVFTAILFSILRTAKGLLKPEQVQAVINLNLEYLERLNSIDKPNKAKANHV